MEIIACDTETTGFDPETCSLLEIAVVGRDLDWWTYIEYEGEIPADARATHHISPEDVRPGADNCISRDSAISALRYAATHTNDRVLAFHNAPFDLSFLPEIADLPVIDTLQCARHLYPDAPNHKNQTLRYYLNTKPRPELLEGLAPHRGLYDAAVTLSIAERMQEDGHSVEELLRLSKAPVLLRTCNFGKHRGELWEDIGRSDRSYLQWMLYKSDMCENDPNLDYTVRYYLGIA